MPPRWVLRRLTTVSMPGMTVMLLSELWLVAGLADIWAWTTASRLTARVVVDDLLVYIVPGGLVAAVAALANDLALRHLDRRERGNTLDVLVDTVAPWLPARRWFQRRERLWWTLRLSIPGALILAFSYLSLSA